MDRLNRILREGLDNIAAEKPAGESLRAILQSSCQWADACRGHIFGYSPKTHQLRALASYSEGRAREGPAPQDPPLLCGPFPADHNPSFYKMCRKAQPLQLGPQRFLEQVWPGTRDWHRQLGHRCALALPLMAAGRPLGEMALVFSHDFACEGLPREGLTAMASQAALVLLLEQLLEQSRERLLSEERNRLAREVHDGVARNLVGVIMALRLTDFAAAEELAKLALQEARSAVFALRPVGMEGRTLGEALRQVAHQGLPGQSMEVEFVSQGEAPHFPACFEHEVYRAVQEGVTNAARHSGADRLRMELSFGSDSLQVTLTDDGVGASGPAGYGLTGMRERIDGLDGSFALKAEAGNGTTLVLTIPYPKPRLSLVEG